MNSRYVLLGGAVLATGFMAGIAYSLADVSACSSAHPSSHSVEFELLRRLVDSDARAQQQGDLARSQLQSISRSISSLREQVAELSAVPVNSAPGVDSAAQVSELAAFVDWNGDASLRSRWASVSADQVRRTLGPPHRVVVDPSAGNTLTYWIKSGDRVTSTVRFRVAGDRVASIAVEPE
jgi:hypothetical protein